MRTSFTALAFVFLLTVPAIAGQRPEGVKPNEIYFGGAANPATQRWCRSWHGRLQIGVVVNGKLVLGAGVLAPDRKTVWHNTFCKLPNGKWAYPNKMGPYAKDR